MWHQFLFKLRYLMLKDHNLDEMVSLNYNITNFVPNLYFREYRNYEYDHKYKDLGIVKLMIGSNFYKGPEVAVITIKKSANGKRYSYNLKPFLDKSVNEFLDLNEGLLWDIWCGIIEIESSTELRKKMKRISK